MTIVGSICRLSGYSSPPHSANVFLEPVLGFGLVELIRPEHFGRGAGSRPRGWQQVRFVGKLAPHTGLTAQKQTVIAGLGSRIAPVEVQPIRPVIYVVYVPATGKQYRMSAFHYLQGIIFF